MANSTQTSQKVAEIATNSIRMSRDAMLIGTFGHEADSTALLRLPSGRVKRVQIGDRVAGLRVTAIMPGQLQATKRGQPVTLTMPGQ
ncbi:amidophosphoribosyltransferase [Lutimaribacter sp. EGI FJ00015]|uniref:Amidophosphoribosyltransferase n=1 Tax=Lutimaribacter degradans TaxID=2945989 RepID=A0ACC5ZT48_9RHOB|nr:amidophosphoribosyltransferase [Lutimaribacter sp. EGI FJ00013]MCM2560946.1 amidophosphoribosyltransferase [Lutimaribacter sp. EGI FJ00013]MCO0612108.1 amidophosphoribosyltransferase [Lutimaribacter sp. EGI FJ00015]MCO0634772.1 amidophosphoribosyltransferase [Lutimaribacter sp. EGI FJ00014]